MDVRQQRCAAYQLRWIWNNIQPVQSYHGQLSSRIFHPNRGRIRDSTNPLGSATQWCWIMDDSRQSNPAPETPSSYQAFPCLRYNFGPLMWPSLSVILVLGHDGTTTGGMA
ncbi:hypothetical protein TGAM01_v201880 [Trichoderma gamsii]|uniref:Uncharacterized protein n=1 Tax=Trichoderma gamsii TaxID=398673 RepID=A0A2P4ZZE2_9HYPO|nr:hypothetical protein TGAM01_v201880 [Trichoderma gamsii]PON29631.1 hypothetical protein TGAM01_v201880 [Trichoderma gamsii]